MTHDLVIRAGTVVDGRGTAAHRADVAIDADRITSIGQVADRGRAEIDAEGLLVTPGFVDLHTHLDAQIGWDPLLTPVSHHGVTTALLGNCGVTFAPCRATDRELLAGMMETVEDIPRDAILGGLPWDWESYGDYLGSVGRLRPAINVGGLIGHCALRYYVMGERAVDEAASPDEIARMAELAGDAVRDGAVGFSTSRFLGHFLPDGRHVPGTHASHDELTAIARAVGDAGGLMQNVLNLSGDFNGELDLLRKEADEGARVLFSITAGSSSSFGTKVSEVVAGMRNDGLDINAVCIPRGSGFISGLQSMPLWSGPTWNELRGVPFEQRLAMVRDASVRARLVTEAGDNPSRLDPAAAFHLGDGDVPDYTAGAERSLATLAREAGESPAATWLRFAVESDGRALFVVRFFNRNLDALAELITTDYCLPGLGDAGAHVSQIMDSGWATFVLGYWTRERGLYSVEEAVRRLAAAPARIMGLTDRGVLAPGMRADVNVIELDALTERMPRIVNDFPGGAPRFVQSARGYRATVCNGQVVLRDDVLTGVRAGRVVGAG